MMKVLMLILFMRSVSFADVEECIYQGKIYGDGRPSSGIGDECERDLKPMAPSHAFDTNEELEVFGYQNIIFIKNNINGKKSYLAGNQTKVSSIWAVDIDSINNTVAVVVNKPKEIFTFPLKYGGNINAYYRLGGEEVECATNVVVHPYLEELVVLCREESLIKFFRREAKKGGREPEGKNNTEVVRVLNTSQFPDDVTFSEKRREMYVLDSKKKKVYVYNWSATDNEDPKEEIDFVGEGFIRIESIHNKLFLYKKFGQKRKAIYEFR